MKNMKLSIQWLALPCLLLMLLISSCSKKDDTSPEENSYQKEVSIEYKITSVNGVTSGDVIYQNATGGNTIVENVSLPYTVKFSRTVKYADNAAINFSGLGAGEVKAEILVDGKVVAAQNYAGTSVITGTAVYLFQ